tara:strand:+ start:73 stop:648 length:576 start_codon:yes stop_codon:yes gene_type:complete
MEKYEEKFEFSDNNNILIKNILKKYPVRQSASAVMPLLDLAMRQCNGWIPESAMKKIGNIINIPFIKVYEVATFYSMFNLRPVGKYLVQFCTTTPCWLKGSDNLLEICKKHLNINIGQTTEDNIFTLKEVECLGACVNAPMIQINDDYFEDLNSETLIQLLNNLKNNKDVKVGTQINGRKGSEPYVIKQEK